MKYTYGFIQEVGEDDVLVRVNNEDIEMPLTDESRQPIFDAVEKGTYIIPIDYTNKKIITAFSDLQLNKNFPELNLNEIADSHEVPEEFI